MDNWTDLKASIAEVIKNNGNQEITGAVLQQVLFNMISNIGRNATFVGVASPSTNPGTPDENVFYICIRPGEYVNFGNAVLKPNSIGILTNSNSDGWTLTQEQIYFNEFNLNVYKPGQYDLTSAIAEALNNVPTAYKKTGFKLFFTDSDGKLRRYIFENNDGGFTNPTSWVEEVDNKYFDFHKQNVGSSYDIANFISEIKVEALSGNLDAYADYSIGQFGYGPSFQKKIIQILKDNVSIGYLLFGDELTSSLETSDFKITITVKTFEPYSSSVATYSKEDNIISKQLFINALLTYSKEEVEQTISEVEQTISEVWQTISEVEQNIFPAIEQNITLSEHKEENVAGYYASSNGIWRADNTRYSSEKIDVVAGEKYKVSTIIGGTTLIAYLAQWNDNNYVGVAEGFTGGSGNAENREYIVPFGVDKIAICSYNTTAPSLKKVSPDKSGNTFYKKNETYSKEEVDSKIAEAKTSGNEVKVYGVRQSLSDPTNTEWERTGDSIGLVSSIQKGNVIAERDDFIDVYPFNIMRECNIEQDNLGAISIIYSGESGFSRAKDTFVEIPLFYMNRYIEDGYEYREICDVQKGGFFPAPMFIENGKILDRVFVAKYETSIDVSGNAHSCTGQLPCIEKTVGEFRELYKKKGKGFAGMDIRTLMSLQHLYLVRFANKNTQNYIGGGYTGLFQPWGTLAKDYSGQTGSKNTITTQSSASYIQDILLKRFWIGSYVGFIRDNESGDPMYDRAKITDIQINEENNQAIITLDKNVEFYDDTLWGSCGQPSGSTDSLVHDTGRSEYAIDGMNGTCGVLLFNLENMWGNVWHELDGVLFKNDTCYISFDQTSYNDSAEGYLPIGHKMLNQPDLGKVGAQFCFIGNLWIDSIYRWMGYPQTVRGGEPTDISMPDSGITQNNSYGDAYYLDNSVALAIDVHGGGFDHYERAGLFCHRCYNSINSKWYLQGSRMQFKILD